MNSDVILNVFQQALIVIGLLTAPLLLSSLVVGLVIGMFQAATQINEMTLSFVPKLIVMAITAIMAGPWMMRVLMTFTESLFQDIPNIIG